MGKCGFLTGWAIPPSFYTLPSNCSVLDTTVHLNDLPFAEIQKWETIIGFSLGAIVALQLAQRYSFKKIVLIAPTFSFCANKQQRYGISQKILDAMILSLESNTEQTLQRFYINCGISTFPENIYTKEQLLAGLNYLRSIDIPRNSFAGNPELIVLHGTNDRIIPIESGREVAKWYNTQIFETTGAHISPLTNLLMNYF